MVTEVLFILDFHTQNNARTLKPTSPTLIDALIYTHTHTLIYTHSLSYTYIYTQTLSLSHTISHTLFHTHYFTHT